MRLNRYLAAGSDLSRRAADQAIADGRVEIDHVPATLGSQVEPGTNVTLDGKTVLPASTTTIALNKPVGVICSRRRQGNTRTLYDLLPPELSHLNPVGRLDKDSSGLIIMTNDGDLAQKLAHPGGNKLKTYQVILDRPISSDDIKRLEDGVTLEDGVSKLIITDHHQTRLTVKLGEGRNRQIRRTFAASGYEVRNLHRTEVGQITLGDLAEGGWRELTPKEVRWS